MNAAFGNLANKPLCASGAAVAEAPGLLWVNAPVTVTSKLSSGLKREYLTNAALDEANGLLTMRALPAASSVFHGVVDAFAVRDIPSHPRPPSYTLSRHWYHVCVFTPQITSSKTADTPDGIHFSDAVYNVIFQIVGNAVLGELELCCQCCASGSSFCKTNKVWGPKRGYERGNCDNAAHCTRIQVLRLVYSQGPPPPCVAPHASPP